MLLLIKLFYAGAIAVLMILLVAFGVRTAYAPPEEPKFVSDGVPRFAPGIQPSPEELELYDQQQREFQSRYDRYREEEADYHRTVLIIATLVGITGVGAGLAMAKSLDAIRLGLVSGGLLTVLYGVGQAAGDLDEAGPGLIFAIAAVGLVVLLAAGYRWLGPKTADSPTV